MTDRTDQPGRGHTEHEGGRMSEHGAQVSIRVERGPGLRLLAAETALAEARRLLEDEPMFVSGIRRAIEKNTDGYGRGGEITHAPRPGRPGSGTCPSDNLTDWLDAIRAVLAAPTPEATP